MFMLKRTIQQPLRLVKGFLGPGRQQQFFSTKKYFVLQYYIVLDIKLPAIVIQNIKFEQKKYALILSEKGEEYTSFKKDLFCRTWAFHASITHVKTYENAVESPLNSYLIHKSLLIDTFIDAFNEAYTTVLKKQFEEEFERFFSL